MRWRLWLLFLCIKRASAQEHPITSSELNSVVQRSVAEVDKFLNKDEVAIFRKGVFLGPENPSWFAAASAKTKVVAKNYSRTARVAEKATKILAQQYNLGREQIHHVLPTLDVRGTALEKECPLTVDFPCKPRKYRAYSGYCNNVQNPRWGNANMPYVRYLRPDYSDYVSSPRNPLLSARTISRTVHEGAEQRPHKYLTVLVAVFAHFVFHDIFHTAQHAGYQGHRIKCCNVSSDMLHPECFSIRASGYCLDYVRSSIAPRIGCTLGPREQINQVTSFLDGSVIYGSSEEEAKRLRSYRDGLLKLPDGLLPADAINQHDCRALKKCFLAGDVRANENAGLAAMHVLWAREHNRIAEKLLDTNPGWTDEQIFEETRRIVGAELQHITYSELLPTLLGRQVLRQFDLEPRTDDAYYHSYDIDLNPGAANAFASAVAASFLSMMPAHFRNKSLPMNESDPELLYRKGTVDGILQGMAQQRAQTMDEIVTMQTIDQGMDRAAWIIQQGRDHGIPGYVDWRRVCRLAPAIRNMTDLRQVMAVDAANKISRIYSNVHDIDLFTGGVSEKPLLGAAVGPTFACLLSRQFQHLKRGDRFWYENDMFPNAFTKDQLQEIRKATLSRIVCDNAGPSLLQPDPLIMADDFLNAVQDCEGTSPAMDFSKWRSESALSTVPKESLRTSLREAMKQAKTRVGTTFGNSIGVAESRSAEAVHHLLLRPKRKALLIANRSVIFELTSRQFLLDSQMQRDREHRPSPAEVSLAMRNLAAEDLNDILRVDEEQSQECRLDEEKLPCDHTARYRSESGWCNNVNHPHWGKALVTLQRMLPPRYQDGVSAPRSLGRAGRKLPSPRLVSFTVHYDTDAPHRRYSLALMQWGQFLDHDLTLTPMHEAPKRQPLDCKACDSTTSVHPECLPIPVPDSDPYFPRNTCIAFARSLAGQLTLGQREQLDQVTSFLDASNMYGSDACEAQMLRTQGGKLNATRHPLGGKALLPQDTTNVECRAPGGICFESGDIRASEQPGLTSMHTIWMREHNRIVEQLSNLNPHWSDDTLYQEARRLVSAMMQHITWKDFLPRVLGNKWMKLFGDYRYDPTCNPTIFNEFSSAAFRFGHTLLKPEFRRLRANSRPKEPIRLRTAFFNPDVLYERGAIDEVLRGLLSTSVEDFDHSITSEVTNHLFEIRGVPFSGMDLVALNLQRGRDHGLPPYNEYRAFCNATRAKKMDDLKGDLPERIVERLKEVYEHVDDIDLFTGGVAEKSMHGALVGLTFGCILFKQFMHLRNCDRFWYETQDPFLRFTPDQLREIRKASLSRIICDNSDAVDHVQANAFDVPDDFLNPRTACRNLPSTDLRHWRDKCQTEKGGELQEGHFYRPSPCVSCSCTREGMVCQSLRITNCFQLASKYERKLILEDDVCKVQCAFAFRTYPHIENILGFSIQS